MESEAPQNMEQTGSEQTGLEQRILDGEVVVMREALQRFDCMSMLTDAALIGIEKSQGKEAAEKARELGFHRIHEFVSAADIPAMTDAVYDEVRELATEFLRRCIPGVFPGVDSYYYEQTPNVRFHIPYDIAAAHKKEFNKFGKHHGQGKITAHGPHRDSWLDCPSNGINLWFAVGRIRPGNGLTVFADDYHTEASHQKSGNISDGEKLHKASSFDLYPGDVVLFHTDHVHGSELNRLDETRFAISFRISIDKPRFENLHYHHYIYSGWENVDALGQIPAMAQASYVRSLVSRIANKFFPSNKEPVTKDPEIIGEKSGETIRVALSEVPVGAVRGISSALCVARVNEDDVVAMTRRCPHQGGDLVNGWIDDEKIVCPWHNLPFCSTNGESDCATLPALKMVRAEISGSEIVVHPKERVRSEQPTLATNG